MSGPHLYQIKARFHKLSQSRARMRLPSSRAVVGNYLEESTVSISYVVEQDQLLGRRAAQESYFRLASCRLTMISLFYARQVNGLSTFCETGLVHFAPSLASFAPKYGRGTALV